MEQRVTSLERSQIDTNHYVTMLMGIVSEQEKDIQRSLAAIEKQTELLMQHSATLIQQNETLTQHSLAIQELLSRLPAKE
jgi:hypothetical protein